MEKAKRTDRGELTPKQMQRVINLVGQIFELGRAFKVYPPKEVTDNPSVLKDQFVSEKLMDTKWWLRFHDGEEALLDFPEILALVHQLREVRRQLETSGVQSGNVKVSFEFAMKHLLEPDTAIKLLNSLDLEGIERKQFRPTFPLYGLHDGEEGQDARLVGAQHPETGHNVVFVFTDEDLAVKFADASQQGRVVRIADNDVIFRQVLRRGSPEVVAFDPVLREGQLAVKTMCWVKEILGE